MHDARRSVVAATTFLAAVAAVGLVRADSAAQETDWSAQAAEAWSGTCRNCHTAPDTVYETDRAFLRQITETS